MIFDLLTLKLVSESRVTWATCANFSLELGPMYAADRRQTDRYHTKASLNASALWDGGITSCARGDTICLRPLLVHNIFVFIRQVAPVPACWLFKTSATS